MAGVAKKKQGKKHRNHGRIRDRCPSHKRAVASHRTEIRKYVKVFRSSGQEAAKKYEDFLMNRKEAGVGIYVPQNIINRETERYERRKGI